MQRTTLALLFVFLSSSLYCATINIGSWQGKGGGSFKSIFDYQRLREEGIFSTDKVTATEQRLRLDGSITRDWFRIEFADELSASYQNVVTSVFPIPDFAPVSKWETTSYLVNTDSTKLTQRVDRAFVQISAGAIDLKVGKQIIDEGVGHIFSAISQVPRYAFIFVDPEYPKTEDAASFLWKGAFTLEIRYLPKVRGQNEDNIHLRAKGGKQGYDLALTAGRSDDKPYAGLEAAGNLGDSLVRAEVVGYEWGGQSALQGLLGWDRVFSPKWSGQFEIFYNGFGSKSNYTLTSFAHRSAPYRGQWYLGGILTTEISIKLKSTLSAIVNLNDPSLLLQLFFTYSITDNMELVAGQYLGIKSSLQSEFGGKIPIQNPAGLPLALGLPDLTYLEMKYYF